jgi:hypothetical protein
LRRGGPEAHQWLGALLPAAAPLWRLCITDAAAVPVQAPSVLMLARPLAEPAQGLNGVGGRWRVVYYMR